MSAEKVPLMWKDDSQVDACEICERVFTILRRRHHCRCCGGIFCDECCSIRACVDESTVPQRVCNNCVTSATLTFSHFDFELKETFAFEFGCKEFTEDAPSLVTYIAIRTSDEQAILRSFHENRIAADVANPCRVKGDAVAAEKQVTLDASEKRSLIAALNSLHFLSDSGPEVYGCTDTSICHGTVTITGKLESTPFKFGLNFMHSGVDGKDAANFAALLKLLCDVFKCRPFALLNYAMR